MGFMTHVLFQTILLPCDLGGTLLPLFLDSLSGISKPHKWFLFGNYAILIVGVKENGVFRRNAYVKLHLTI